MRKILVVDDELAIRAMLEDLLSDEGYSVVVANNGARALEVLNHERPDLVIMDVMMPELDGREVLRKMRRDTTLRRIPVILMSAATAANPADDHTSLFLAKPFDLHELLRCVEIALEEHE